MLKINRHTRKRNFVLGKILSFSLAEPGASLLCCSSCTEQRDTICSKIMWFPGLMPFLLGLLLHFQEHSFESSSGKQRQQELKQRMKIWMYALWWACFCWLQEALAVQLYPARIFSLSCGEVCLKCLVFFWEKVKAALVTGINLCRYHVVTSLCTLFPHRDWCWLKHSRAQRFSFSLLFQSIKGSAVVTETAE